ncbi:MAG: hypothetical protein JXR96_15615 [Deltaproteobacteria bacterium]|nr:hypothetical protein [Deltaproteobacteria bacterium]
MSLPQETLALATSQTRRIRGWKRILDDAGPHDAMIYGLTGMSLQWASSWPMARNQQSTLRMGCPLLARLRIHNHVAREL